MQVEALNAINATLKSRVDKQGGKQISKEQLKTIEEEAGSSHNVLLADLKAKSDAK